MVRRCVVGRYSEVERCVVGRCSEVERCVVGRCSEVERCVVGRCVVNAVQRRILHTLHSYVYSTIRYLPVNMTHTDCVASHLQSALPNW